MAESDLDRVIVEQNLIEDEWNAYRGEVIDQALKTCEKHGYPTSDEPLCCLIEDILDNAREHITSTSQS